MKLALSLAVCSATVLAACTAGAPSPKFAAELEGLTCEAAPPPTRIEGPRKETLRLVAVGDTGLALDDPESHLRQTLDAIRAIGDTHAILLLGDNVYDCSLRDFNDPNWTKVIAPLLTLSKPIYPVLANHDWGSRTTSFCRFSNPNAEIMKSGRPGFERWTFPAHNHVVDTPSAEIILYDSTPIAEDWPGELQRSPCVLRNALSQPKKAPAYRRGPSPAPLVWRAWIPA